METDARKESVLAHIHEMLEPWIKKGEEENYFRVKSFVYNGYDNVFSKGLLMSGSRDAKDKIAFEVSFLHESSRSMYRTINCKPLEELSVNELLGIKEAVADYIKRDRIAPAVIRDYYSDTISSENDWFSSVDFGRPVDGEMYEANEYIEDRDKNEAILPDFDQAIYYAEKVSLALERRGQLWNLDDHYFHVTVESDDPRVLELAKEYDGIAVSSNEEGVPLTMATFKASSTARCYSEHVNRMLNTELFRKSPQYRLEKYLSARLKDADDKFVLDDTLNLHYHKTHYQDADLRNAREICRLTGKRFAIQGVGDITNIVVANKSGSYVNIADLTDTSSRVLLKHLESQEFKESKVRLKELINEVRSDIGNDFDFPEVKLDSLNGGNEKFNVVSFNNGTFYDFNSDGKVAEEVIDSLTSEEDIKKLSSAIHEAHMVRLEYAAVTAIHDRIVSPSARSFTEDQIKMLNRYHQKVLPEVPVNEVFSMLLKEATQESDVARKPEKWITDTAKELNDLAEGITREESRGLHI